MSSSREFLDRLQAADRSLAKERMPRASARRVAKRISRELETQARPSRMGWIPMLTFVAGAALVLLFLRWSTDDDAPRGSAEPEQLATVVQVSGPACRSHSDETTEVWGACTLEIENPSMSVDTIEASHLEVHGRVIHLRTGSALFDVDKVHGEPVRIATPQGDIIVVGTRFRVVVEDDRSQVDLYEGRLEFHDPSGRVTPIEAGQHMEFGTHRSDAASPPPPAIPAATAEPEATAPAESSPRPNSPAPQRRPAANHAGERVAKATSVEDDAGPVIAAAEKLRREGRYAEAAKTLRVALKRRWPTRTADVLSYELGRLLERRMRDKTSACTHWGAHLKRFAKTRYRVQIERSMGTLDCP